MIVQAVWDHRTASRGVLHMECQWLFCTSYKQAYRLCFLSCWVWWHRYLLGGPEKRDCNILIQAGKMERVHAQLGIYLPVQSSHDFSNCLFCYHPFNTHLLMHVLQCCFCFLVYFFSFFSSECRKKCNWSNMCTHNVNIHLL